MIVMKFGGTSVANFEAITRTIFIIGSKLDKKPVVVVSALSKITDLLYAISDAATAKDAASTTEYLAQLRKRHVDLTEELLAQSVLKEEAVAKVNVFTPETLVLIIVPSFVISIISSSSETVTIAASLPVFSLMW